ncbi:copper chaperone CopZ [Lysinibacillus sp. SGAir0095]|uniref:copper chaperone CopZ n=1 Tax=Lysinibacillus sp. SGAir0095 TaxID=2070463 RepID=UPI0010CCF094|nr:copper chaperone CopZ [Lysinibacillus sp. SGAir0095]QCR31322.1 copper resistance protein CopZ [Lysinibacillus sp. SGAir0095]
MKNVTLNVKGMSCGHCVKAVEGGVGALEGVEQVNVNLEAGKVNVAYNDQKVSLTQIKEAIDDQGYDVE